MSEEKKYFYIKLEEGYFGSKFQKALRSQANGVMTIVYLKMQLKYAQSNGYFTYDGLYPSVEEELAIDIEEKVEDVRMTLNFLSRFEFIQRIDEDEYFLIEMQNRIGSVSDAALRKARSRERQCAYLGENTQEKIE